MTRRSEADDGALAFALARVALLTACCGLLFGYSTASIAGWLDEIAREFDLDTSGKEYFTVSLVFFCFVGAVAAGPAARTLGRRMALLIAFVLAIAGYGLTLFHPGLWWLVGARVLTGLAVGLSSMVGPMYAAEATPARHRGSVVSLFQLAVTLGILAAYAVPLALEDPTRWASAIGGGGIIALIGVLALASVPESPIWLDAAGRGRDAAFAAAKLGFLHQPQMDSARAGAPGAKGSAGLETFGDLLRNRTVVAVLLLCCGMFILQNLSGIDGILYYAPTIFIELGFTPGLAALGATFGLGVINVAATIVAIATVDRLGRRPLAIVGSLAMIVGLLGVVAAQTQDYPMLGLVGLCVYIAAFAISLGPLPYVLMSELVPSKIRETGIAAASATSWLFNALVALFFLTGVSLVGLSGVFFFFAAVCGVALAISMIWLPETKGRNLDAIEDNVTAGMPLRRLGDTAPVG